MSEMVERVAKAIADNIQAGLPDGVTMDYGYAARAAIEAMRYPTTEMLYGHPCCTSDGRSYVLPVIEIWPKMIDAALK